MKFLKYLLIFILGLFVVGFVAVKMMSEDLPAGGNEVEADRVAKEMMAALNKSAFDNIPYLRWEFFRPGQKYFWDKNKNAAVIEWGGNHKVILDLNSLKARAYVDGAAQSGAALDEMKEKAWSLWANDSFWMIAPFKAFDPGTERKMVALDDVAQPGDKGLMVSYTSGGVTPGDSYLWYLDENYRPYKWKMWTSILPVQGMETSWEGWEEHGGAWLSTVHNFAGVKEAKLNQVKAGANWSEFGYETDPFLQ